MNERETPAQFDSAALTDIFNDITEIIEISNLFTGNPLLCESIQTKVLKIQSEQHRDSVDIASLQNAIFLLSSRIDAAISKVFHLSKLKNSLIQLDNIVEKAFSSDSDTFPTNIYPISRAHEQEP